MENKFVKRVLSIVLTGTMVLSLAACGSGSGSGSGETASGKTDSAGNEETSGYNEDGLYKELTVAMAQDWKDLEPKNPNQDGKSYFIYNIYESLFDLNDQGQFVGNLATGYEATDEYTYVVDIYDSIKDSDGNNITASDVVFSVNWLVESGNALGYEAFESIEATGDYQVTWHFSEAMTGVKSLEQFFLRTFVFSEKAYNEHNFATDPVGTGNYKLESATTGSSMTLVVRDDYWGNDETIQANREAYHTATVEKVTFEVIAEAAQAAIALETDSIDMCAYIADDMLYEFEDGGAYADKYNVITALSSDHYVLGPNKAEESHCSDENLCFAIYYALNNDAIATAMGGAIQPMKGLGFSYFGDYNTAWDSEENYVNTCDLELAKSYLAKTGYNGETLTMVGLNSEVVKNAMTMIQSQLAQIGINVEIKSFDQNTLNATIAEKTGWDFMVGQAGGTSFIGTYGGFNPQINNGYNKYWVSDEKLEELRQTALADATHDDEHVKAFIDYVLEKGYFYGIAVAATEIVTPKDVTEVYLREGYYTPCACTFE